MGHLDSPRRSRISFAQESLLKYLEDLDGRPSVPPTLDFLLDSTHTLSNRMQGLLGIVLRAYAASEEPLRDEMESAVEEVTESITCLKELMLTIHRLRRSSGVQRDDWSDSRVR